VPLRHIGKDYIRDPFKAGSGDYVTHPDSVRKVLEWYERERAEYPSRSTPDMWDEISREEKDGTVKLVLQRLFTDAAIEVTYRVSRGTELDFQARALPPEEAYGLALEQDERAIANGDRIFNERHPMPETP
jgi:hypothetical protein